MMALLARLSVGWVAMRISDCCVSGLKPRKTWSDSTSPCCVIHTPASHRLSSPITKSMASVPYLHAQGGVRWAGLDKRARGPWSWAKVPRP